jgi:HEAT repeat protein
VPSFRPPDVEKLRADGDAQGLIKALGYRKDARVRRDAAEALGSCGDAGSIEFLMTALKDESWSVRKAAVQALGQIQYSRALGPFMVALEDGSEEVRKAAALALGHIGDISAVQPLVSALHDDSWGVRGAAAKALGELGDAGAVEPLGYAVLDADLGVREAAAGALVRIGAPALEPLLVDLQAQSWDVRRTAARALGQIGDRRAVGPLSAALRDPQDGWLRRDAARALGEIGDGSAVDNLATALHDRDAEVRDAAAEALAALGRRPGKLRPQSRDQQLARGSPRGYGPPR